MEGFAAEFDLQNLLDDARNGRDEALGQVLDHYRPYLKLLARLWTRQQLRAKFDDSDLVQETMVLVSRDLSQFRGTSEAEFTAWLRRIMAGVSGKLIRHYASQRRNILLERQLEVELDQSSERVGYFVAAAESSPSERIAKRERAVILSRALAELPADYREALILHRLEGLTMAEAALRMGRSVDSVQKLLARGLLQLRRKLEDQL